MTPHIASLQRHPLKSHGREALESVTLSAGRGLPWDRRWAVAHEAAKIAEGAWAPCANFSIGSKAPALMAIESVLDEATATLTLRHPDRPEFSFRPDHADEAAGFLDWVRPLCPPERSQPARIYSVPDRGLTDTDYPSVSLISLASTRALGEHLGLALSPHRWRANLWIDGLPPWQERGWVGKRLRIGTATLEISEPKTRCLATTANPATGQRDADTLVALQALFGDRDFGLYARVIEGGDIATGAAVEVLS